jgi:hypothetical protein
MLADDGAIWQPVARKAGTRRGRRVTFPPSYAVGEISKQSRKH